MENHSSTSPTVPMQQHSKLNPFLTVWYKPRATFRSAIDHKSMNLAIFLALIAGMAEMYNSAVAGGFGDWMSVSAVLIVVFLVGVIIGLIPWFICSGIFLGIGKLLGGKASFHEMLIAQGIALIPLALSMLLCFFDIIFLGDALFSYVEISFAQTLWLIISGLISLILTIWSIFLMVKAIEETHQLPAWKGFLVFAIPAVILVLLVIFLFTMGAVLGVLLI